MDNEAQTALFRLGETQLGLFTLAQADELGITERRRRTLLQHKVIRPIYRNVFSFAGHRLSPAGTHLASVFAGGDTARSTHRAGAWLWDMTSFEQKPEITTTDRLVRIKGIRCHFTTTDLLARATRKGVPVATAAEVLLDLSAVKPIERVRDALDRGIANGHVTPMSALAELDRRGGTGVRGTAGLRALLDEAGLTGSHKPSVLEAKTRRLIAKAGLPQPVCELVVGCHGEYRLDFCWPELMLAIEVEGWMYHSSFAAFYGNKSRRNALVVEGYTILEYTWKHVTSTPSAFIREVQEAYQAQSQRSFAIQRR